jgi:NAD(P)-dependent dehydrogenase (short-subunit alcohol dehydrogenase family)
MGNRLTGKTILITGGCGDIGRAVAEASLDEGADQVVVVDLPDALASGSVWPPRVRLQACDVADRGAVD